MFYALSIWLGCGRIIATNGWKLFELPSRASTAMVVKDYVSTTNWCVSYVTNDAKAVEAAVPFTSLNPSLGPKLI